MSLEIITGNLNEAYKQIQSGTMQHVDELQAAKVTDLSLRDQSFYTADYNQYALRGKKQVPTLGIARERHNLILRNIDEASRQLTQGNNYRPSVEEAEQVFRARGKNGTVLVDLTKLELERYDSEVGYFEIGTSPREYNSLNPEQKKLAERVEGKGATFTAVMKMLKNFGVASTRIYVLNPNYVREYAAKGPIGRAAWLGCYDNDFSLIAGNLLNLSGAARGVRCVVAVGDAEKNGVPSAPLETPAIAIPRIEEILACLGDDIAPSVRPIVEARIRKLGIK